MPVHDEVSGSPSISVAKSTRPASEGSNEPEIRRPSSICSRCNVTPSSGSGRRPCCSSIQRMCDANREMFAWASIHCASRSLFLGSPVASSPSSSTANVPSDRRTTTNDAPLAEISRGRKAPERSRSSGSIEKVSSASRITASDGVSAGVSPPASRTSLIRNTGVHPRQWASIVPSATCRSAMWLNHRSISGR